MKNERFDQPTPDALRVARQRMAAIMQERRTVTLTLHELTALEINTIATALSAAARMNDQRASMLVMIRLAEGMLGRNDGPDEDAGLVERGCRATAEAAANLLTVIARQVDAQAPGMRDAMQGGAPPGGSDE